MRAFLGQNDMMAYLTMMAQRMIELHRVLKPTGSIYLHCDPTASHYLKLLLDAVFGAQQFRNEIVWQRTIAKGLMSKQFANNHDVIISYRKTIASTWNLDATFQPYDEISLDTKTAAKYSHRDADGRLYRLDNLTNPNRNRPNLTYEFLGVTRVWRWTKERMQAAYDQGLVVQTRPGAVPSLIRYLDEQRGRPFGDVWTDIPPINSQAKERLGYPTQKPEALLERIINASSSEGDVVLDPFCGCGTAVVAAERLNRQWMGIDITHLAISLIRHRLHDTFGSDLRPYDVIGEPEDAGSAEALARQDRYQFEWWALGLVDARPARDKRKGADSGIDGYINFFDDNSGKPKRIVVQVKSGHVNRGMIATLKGDMEREKAELGLFVTLEEPTRPMLQEAVAAGFYEPEHYPGQQYPRLQILTIDELLAGKPAEYPRMGLQTTFRQAPRRRRAEGQQSLLA